MKKQQVNKSEFNKYCQISDLLAAIGVGCYEQRGVLRHYMLINHKTGAMFDFTVNTARNEWISRRDNRYGQAADIIDYLRGDMQETKHYYETDLMALVFHYANQQKMPKSYPTVNIHIGMKSFIEVGELESHSAISLLTRHGITNKTAEDCGVREIKLHFPGRKEVVSQLAFPCDSGDYYVFDDKTFRPLDRKSISTIGFHHQFQVCNVFENWLDYLAFQERRHQTGQYLLADDYNLIINGKGNIKEAMQFLRNSPDFLEVRSFMPKTEEGNWLTQRVMEATKGSAIDCSYSYAKTGSLSADILPKLPEWYEEISRKEEERKRKKEAEKIQKMEDKKHDTRTKEGLSNNKNISSSLKPKETVGKGKEVEIIIDKPKSAYHR